MAGHSLALTGEGYLSPDEYDVEFDIRCTECTDANSGKILIFSEDYVDASHPPHVPHNEVLRAVARHLEPDLPARIPPKLSSQVCVWQLSATTLASVWTSSRSTSMAG